jgi:hypothetical protein
MNAANETGSGADAQPERDHMGRRKAETVGEAFSQDWPWVLALVALVTFVIAAMSGHLRF